MSDDKLIRLENLLSLKKSAAQLSESVGGRYTYWRDLLAGEKSFGEKIARKIEEQLQLPRNWLDHPGDEAGKPKGFGELRGQEAQAAMLFRFIEQKSIAQAEHLLDLIADIHAVPDSRRLEAIIAAGIAVKDVRYPKRQAASEGGASAPSPSRRRSPETAPKRVRATKPRRTAV